MTAKAKITLPAEAYPLTIEAINMHTDAVVWTAEVTGPEVLYVPPLRKTVGAPIRVRITFADETVVEFDGP